MATLPEFEEGQAPERLPASLWFYVRLLAFGAVLILILVQIDALAGAITAAAIAAVALLFYPRGLVLDEEGFRVLSLVPRKKVLWNAVDSFGTGWVPRGGAIVQYTKAGRKPRSWYPAGWPAQGSFPPAFAAQRGGRALRASALCDLMNDRLARARAATPHSAWVRDG
jgi:hypothetical protein